MRSGAIFEAPAFIPSFNNVAMVGETIEECGCHLGVAEDARPFAKGQIGGDDDRGALIELAHEMEEQLPASLSERQIAKLIENGDHQGFVDGRAVEVKIINVLCQRELGD